MYFKSLSIDGYRNLRNLEIEFNPDLTILVGKNNSGKSNILSAIEFIIDVLSGNYFAIAPGSSLLPNSGPISGELAPFVKTTELHHDKPGEIRARITVSLSPTELESIFGELPGWNTLREMYGAKLSELTITLTIQVLRRDGQNVLKYTINDIDGIDGFKIVNREIVPGRVNVISDWDQKVGYNKKQDVIKRIGETIAYSDTASRTKKYLRVRAERTISRVPENEQSSLANNLVDSRSVVMDLFRHETDSESYKSGLTGILAEEMSTLFPEEPRHKALTVTGTKGVDVFFGKYPSGQVGSGVLQVLNCLRQSHVDTADTIAIEEPEVHLHPDLQRSFFKHLLTACRGKQLILTTHSPSIVAECPLGSVRLIEQTKNGTLAVQILNVDDIKRVVDELGVKPRDLGEFDKVLFVEDDAMKAYFQRAIELHMESPSRIAVVETNGYGNIKAYANAKLAMVLNRPFIAVCDGDMRNDATKKNNIERFLSNSRMPRDRVEYLDHPSIEHYIALPSAITRAFPQMKPESVHQTLESHSGKNNMKHAFEKLFSENLKRNYTQADLQAIAAVLRVDDIPADIWTIIERLQKLDK